MSFSSLADYVSSYQQVRLAILLRHFQTRKMRISPFFSKVLLLWINPKELHDAGSETLGIKGRCHCGRRRQWHPTPVLLPGKSHGQRSLEGCSPWGRWRSDTTERLHFHFSLSCVGEGNGNPLQCSCLENPRDGKPGGLPSMGSHRVGHDWSDLAAAAAAVIVAGWQS